MKAYYYLDVKRKVHGPHTQEELAGMLKAGTLEADTEVASPGDKRWVRLGSLVKPEQVVAVALPPVPVPVGAPGKCPSCEAELSVREGGLPAECPACGRVLRPAKGGFWANAFFPIRQYAVLSGRATRAEYWTFVLVWGVLEWALLLAGLITCMVGAFAPESHAHLLYVGGAMAGTAVVLMLALLIPTISVQVRRLHDAGWNGWWMGGYLLCQWGYMAAYYFCCWDEVTAVRESVQECFQQGGAASMHSLQFALHAVEDAPMMVELSVLNAVAHVLWLLLFVVSFIDSNRGPNKYGPSAKYPMG